MSKFKSDQDVAKAMLAVRGPEYTFGTYFRRMQKQYAILLLLFVSIILVAELYGQRDATLIVAAIAVAMFARDIGWVLSIRSGWSFIMKVTKWELVQAYADGNEQSELSNYPRG